jgi:hypothetical protein
MMSYLRLYGYLQCGLEIQRRMASSGMLRHVTLVRTDVSEERIASIIRVTRIVAPEQR